MQPPAAPRAHARRQPRDAAPHVAAEPARSAVTELAIELAALRTENTQLRDTLARLPHGLAVWDADNRLVLANARYQALWGLPDELLAPGTPYADIAARKAGEETEKSRAQPPLPPGQPGTTRREWQLPDGRRVEVHAVRAEDGRTVALYDDVTALRQAESQIAFLARHDALTGLPNRAVLAEELERALLRNARGEEMALLSLDIDRFKAVNDTFGHGIGDALLKQVAQRLRQVARDTDLVVHLGGDEFAVLQIGAPQPSSSTAMSRRAIESLGRPFEFEGQAVHVGLSVGVAVAPFDGYDAPTLMRNADLALTRAKADGRGTVRYFEREMDARMQARRGLEADLRQALAAEEFELAYQPQVDLHTQRVSGVEALIRWRHPRRGVVSPADFIPLAEETGLIVPVGRWVLEQACRDAAAWPEGVRIAVNVSAVQFRHGGLLQDVQAALTTSGLAPQRLEVEITESVMLQDAVQALVTLHELRTLGVRVAMDDFGTGYSSLSTLRRFPFDRIKIDRSFVKDAASRPDTLAIVRAVVELGHGLGMGTTVEGVETQEQLAAVERQGCEEVQGFLFSKPRPAADIPELIATLPGSVAR